MILASIHSPRCLLVTDGVDVGMRRPSLHHVTGLAAHGPSADGLRGDLLERIRRDPCVLAIMLVDAGSASLQQLPHHLLHPLLDDPQHPWDESTWSAAMEAVSSRVSGGAVGCAIKPILSDLRTRATTRRLLDACAMAIGSSVGFERYTGDAVRLQRAQMLPMHIADPHEMLRAIRGHGDARILLNMASTIVAKQVGAILAPVHSRLLLQQVSDPTMRSTLADVIPACTDTQAIADDWQAFTMAERNVVTATALEACMGGLPDTCASGRAARWVLSNAHVTCRPSA